ncbi:unnamed protein product [Trifolium pratense]|uniref:Uncharacterized protein n=1 Tax=Trifolium pratense TaxID=57577 RepID=A0ACB0J1P1_TRIPR|nr:unnamed protein product [Trifolium pratense]
MEAQFMLLIIVLVTTTILLILLLNVVDHIFELLAKMITTFIMMAKNKKERRRRRKIQAKLLELHMSLCPYIIAKKVILNLALLFVIMLSMKVAKTARVPLWEIQPQHKTYGRLRYTIHDQPHKHNFSPPPPRRTPPPPPPSYIF